MSNLNPLALSASQYVKAIVAGLIAALSVLAGAVGDGVSSQEVVATVSAALVGFYAVFLTPNKAAEGSADPNLSEQDAGHGAVDALIGLVIVLVCLFLIFKLVAAIF